MRLRRRPHAHRSPQQRVYGRLVALVLLVAYAVAFILENGKSISVHFVLGTAHASLVWVILLSLGVGLLGGILLAELTRRRHRRPDERSQPGDPV